MTRKGDKSKWGRLKKRCKPTGRVKGKNKGKRQKLVAKKPKSAR